MRVFYFLKIEVIISNETKAELKRQAVAKKLHPQLIKTADLLRDYYDTHCTLMRENGDSLKIRGYLHPISFLWFGQYVYFQPHGASASLP